MMDVYDTAELVYTGRKEDLESQKGGSNNAPPVFSAHGMTFYLDILRELSDRPEIAGSLHVVPGNITLQSNQVYTMVRDPPPSDSMQHKVTNYKAFLLVTQLEPIDISSAGLEAKLMKLESVGALAIKFSFSKASTHIYYLGPTDLTNRLARSSYSVFCPRHLRRPSGNPLSSVFTVLGEGIVNPKEDTEAGRLVIVRQLHGNVVARCLSLFQASKYGETHRDYDLINGIPPNRDPNRLYQQDVILRSNECWSCCIKNALLSSRKGRGGFPVTYII